VVDLAGLLIILAALFASGPPDRIEWSASIGLTASYGPGGMSGAVVIGIDPTPVWYRPAPEPWGWNFGWNCGKSDGYNIWVLPGSGCLDHELIHVRQRQAVGWLGMALLATAGELEPYQDARGDMARPYGLNFPLLRLAIPIRWEEWHEP